MQAYGGVLPQPIAAPGGGLGGLCAILLVGVVMGGCGPVTEKLRKRTWSF